MYLPCLPTSVPVCSAFPCVAAGWTISCYASHFFHFWAGFCCRNPIKDLTVANLLFSQFSLLHWGIILACVMDWIFVSPPPHSYVGPLTSSKWWYLEMRPFGVIDLDKVTWGGPHDRNSTLIRRGARESLFLSTTWRHTKKVTVKKLVRKGLTQNWPC